MHSPLVSILIPVYNRKHMLIACLESALAQTVTDFEVVVVDNASTDGAWEVCQEFAKRDSRVRIFRNETNIGPCFNGLRCIAEARGYYGKTLFSDDLISLDFLEKTLPLIANPEVGFVFTAAEIGREPGQGTINYKVGEHPGTMPSQEFIYYSLFRQGQIVPNSPGAGLFRLEDIRKYVLMEIPSPTIDDFLDHGMGVDILQYLRTANQYPLVAYVPEPLAFFRAHEDSETILSLAKRPWKWIFCYQQAKIWFASQYSSNTILQSLLIGEWVREFHQSKNWIPFREIVARFLHKSEEISLPSEQSNQLVADLRHARKHLADFSIITPPHLLESTYLGFAAQVYRTILNSGIKDEPLTETEQAFVDELLFQFPIGFDHPKAINYLLAAMLYCRGEQLPLPHGLNCIPWWLIYEYIKFSKGVRIIVDSAGFQLDSNEISSIWISLLEAWVENDFAKYIVVADRAGTAPKIPGIWYRTVPPYDHGTPEADREMLQQICDEEGAKLFISSYYTTPISTPSVFMACDMIPEIMEWNLGHPMWQGKHYAIQQASTYIAISENTARDLVKFFPQISPESVTVAPCGVKSTFLPASLEEINSFKIKYGISKPYFILAGADSGYKNSILFFKAFSKLYSRQGFEIVCNSSGVLLEEFRSHSSGSVVHMLQLSDEELRAAYSGAVALVYSSKYEGFGLPVLEAIACGCPVITCPNASIPEVAGEAALYVNDEDVDGLIDALCDVQKPKVRNSLIAAGLEQAKKFSWSKMAKTVTSALMDATLLPLNLKDINLIIFPDWLQPEELLCLELQRVIGALATHPDSNQITLLVDSRNISNEDAALILSSITMNLLLQEDLDVTEGLEISLIGKLGEIQWEALLPRIEARIVLKHENEQAIAQVGAKAIPSWQLQTETLVLN